MEDFSLKCEICRSRSDDSVIIEISLSLEWNVQFYEISIIPSHMNCITVDRIWGSHCGEYEDGCLLGCSAM
jgi:hypothetical protein